MDHAGVGFEVASENIEQGGFARAVLATQKDDVTLAEVEIHAGEHDLAPEGLLEAPSLDNAWCRMP